MTKAITFTHPITGKRYIQKKITDYIGEQVKERNNLHVSERCNKCHSRNCWCQ